MFAKQQFSIGNHQLGRDGDLFIIAEIGLSHDGSLGTAIALVDAAVRCGADAVKFQTHLADQESTERERFRVPVFPQDNTRQDYWRRTAFSLDQWKHLAQHTRSKGLVFMSSPFSDLAVDWLMECDVPVWKIASGELTNYPMIRHMCQTNRPILLSSGMSSWRELDETIGFIETHGGSYGVFQCTTAYPCPPEQWGLNVIDQMRQRYDCPVGLSDHSGTPTPGLAAVVKGATLLEVHIAFSKEQFGPDTSASLTLEQLQQLVASSRQLHVATKSPIDKDFAADQFADLHRLFSKSIVAAAPLCSGHTLIESDLTYKKPGDGIPAKDFQSILGKTLQRDVVADHFFSADDFLE